MLVGCGSGGLLARRYIMLGGYDRVAYAFMLGSTHRHSQLAYLRDTIFEPRSEDKDDSLPVAAPDLDRTVLVNIYSDLDPAFDGVHLPDAVNVTLPLSQAGLCRDRQTYATMRQYLVGAQWLVTVRLRSLHMRAFAGSDDLYTGPFCFEVNGQRAPFDGHLRAPVEQLFEFDAARTLLSTLTFPLAGTGRAINLDFRLKDLSPRGGPRRMLVASLHTPLRDDLTTEHFLQASLGSEVHIQVCCKRPKAVIDVNDEL
jgi:hypothetical protein